MRKSMIKRTLSAVACAVFLTFTGCEREPSLAEKVFDKPIYDYNYKRHLSQEELKKKRGERSESVVYRGVNAGPWPECATGAIIEWETESARNVMYLGPNQSFIYTPKKGFAVLTDIDNDGKFDLDERTYYNYGGASGPIEYRRAKESVKPYIAYMDSSVHERFEALDKMW